MLFAVKYVLWFLVSTVVELASAFIIAGILLLILNWTGVAFLAGLTYWQLYWIQMAIYESLSGAVVIGNAASDFFGE